MSVVSVIVRLFSLKSITPSKSKFMGLVVRKLFSLEVASVAESVTEILDAKDILPDWFVYIPLATSASLPVRSKVPFNVISICADFIELVPATFIGVPL